MTRQPNILLKVDRNGTKTWGNCTCQRCGGHGGSEQWAYTGYTCYECGGTGISKMRTWKEYTPEHQAELDARRAKREEKARLARIAELEANMAGKYAERGFNANGKLYAVIEKNSFDIKEELKAAGARWSDHLKAWTFADRPTAYKTVEVDFTECYLIDYDNGTVRWNEDVVGKNLIKSKIPVEEGSSYLGEEGKKLETEATLKGGYEYESSYGYHSKTTLVAIFEDLNGNKLVWRTQTAFALPNGGYAFWDKAQNDYMPIQQNQKVRISGTVKSHSEYRGERQTELTRAKVSLAS